MKTDKLVLSTYLVVFILFLTIVRMNPVIIGLAGALPALLGAALAFLNKDWVRRLLMYYGLAVFLLQIVFAGNFFLHFFESDNVFVVLLLIPLPIASLIMLIAGIVKRFKKQ